MVTHRTFSENAGGYTLQYYFDQSPAAVLREYYPDHDWKPWFFAFPGTKFWKSADNRRQYLDWLGATLGFKTPSDWRQLRHDDLRNNHGTTLLKHYRRSLAAAMKEYLPDSEWEEWLFPNAGGDFWTKPHHRQRYLAWLGETLGVKKPEDWYAIKTEDIVANRGGQMLDQYYGGSVSRMLRELMPEHDWLEWKFRQVPRRFFDDAANRGRFLRWFAQEAGIRRPDDWYSVRLVDIGAGGGQSLLQKSGSLFAAPREWQPDHDWKEWLFYSSKQPFWNDAPVRRRYLLWLAGVIEFRRREDWLRIRAADFTSHHGERLLRQHGGSVARVVIENLPELGFTEGDFESTFVRRRRSQRNSRRQ